MKEEKEGYVVVQEILGEGMFKLEKKEGMRYWKSIHSYSVLFCRIIGTRTMISIVISSLMFINDWNGSLEKQIVELAEVKRIR